MIKRLLIQNYALIDYMELEFDPRLNVITGETGAGKSIILGGLSLILGKRANKESLKNHERKMIVEAVFDIAPYNLQAFFEEHDLDYEPETVIRREITPSGKSRAFVNDTPVLLDTLEALGKNLVDLHGQYSHLLLKDKNFMVDFLDAFAKIDKESQTYRQNYRRYLHLKNTLEKALAEKKRLEDEKEFRLYQLNELRTLNWDLNLEEAERHLKNFDNLERIRENIQQILSLLSTEEIGLHDQIRQTIRLLNNLAKHKDEAIVWTERMEEIAIDLREFESDLEQWEIHFAGIDEAGRKTLEEEYDRYQQLMLKHRVNSQEELKQLLEKWEAESEQFERMLIETESMENELETMQKKLQLIAEKLHEKRAKAAPVLAQKIEKYLADLGMKHSRIKIVVEKTETLGIHGFDQPEIHLSPDKGKHFAPVSQIASGGEMSRLMLAIKNILSRHKQLPTIIFDEIDAGISGEVAKKTAGLIKSMSNLMQVITITHLPQTAAAGDRHFKVFKTETNGRVISRVKPLSFEERIQEIAEIIEGKPPSSSALQHAENLLKTSPNN